MRRLLLLVLAGSALARSPEVGQKLRDAQQAFGAGDCVRAQATLREVLAADPKNFVAHLLAGHCLLREKNYGAAAGEFRRALETRADAQPALLGLIQACALSGDRTQRDAEIEHVRALIAAGKLPKTVRFVREQFAAGDRNVVASEYPYVSLLRSRYVFEVAGAQPFELVFREPAFSLISGEKTLRVYPRGEPAYEQVVADVKAALSGKTLSAGDYTVAAKPAVIVPFPITPDDPSDSRLHQLTIEYIAHSCFRIHTSRGSRILIDPFASRMWLGYDFPPRLAADAVLITHPHYDHDADVLLGGQPAPWAPSVRVLRDPGAYTIADATITGIRGKHADPWGKEFGQTNTIWLIEVDGLRIAHLGDNGPLTEENIKELGRVDIVMMPIDAKHHILKEAEIEAIRKALHPRIVIPMHYRIPDLEATADSPEGLGEIGPWLAAQQNVVQLESNRAIFTAASLLPSQMIVVFPHSPLVRP
jgi:L-ascorbate metabolism protein UlaG (beta-lactamase superfamily)